MRVLVIDDSRAMRKIISAILLEEQHEVTEATNGQEGLDRLESGGPFDLALVDWNMPVLSGIEFVSRARADRRHAAMKIVMVTTEVETSQICRALEAGANEYVMKPFTRDVLRGKLQMLSEAAA